MGIIESSGIVGVIFSKPPEDVQPVVPYIAVDRIEEELLK